MFDYTIDGIILLDVCGNLDIGGFSNKRLRCYANLAQSVVATAVKHRLESV